MTKWQNDTVAFRCPKSLKEKMMAAANANEEHLSSFIRSACSESIKRQFPPYIPSQFPAENHQSNRSN